MAAVRFPKTLHNKSSTRTACDIKTSTAFEIKLLHIDIEHKLLQKQSVITESHEQRVRLSKYCEERKAPPFLLHGQRPKHQHFHVFEGRSTDKKAMIGHYHYHKRLAH